MIRLCRKAGLPEPEFHPEGERFVAIIRRDWLTDVVVEVLALNERQRKAIAYVREHTRITNTDYRRLADTIKKTASRDLDDLIAKGVLKRVGTTGRGTYYCLAAKRDRNGTKGTPDGGKKKGT